jgi:ubiquinone/menaquinone biosynthesis C-methylase UbiE
LPYMNIPRVLTELHRVLKPKGSLFLSLHSCRFTLRELATIALPKPIPTAYRLYVFGNGLWFHFTGRTLRFSAKRTESFQTERGMRKALTRAGYCDIRFTRTALRFTVEAVRA